MDRQSYWFVHKPIEDIKNNWIKDGYAHFNMYIFHF